jgi:hypothetical protein
MKRLAVIFAIGLGCALSALAQRPSNPALLVPQEAPVLEYVAVPNPLPVPDAAAMGASSDVAFDAKGHLYVLSRGMKPLTEFDENGKFIRAFGEAHFVAVSPKGEIYIADSVNRAVQKFVKK